MKEFYSFTKRGYFNINEADNFLSKLMNLEMQEIPYNQRKKIGPCPPFGTDNRKLWQPQMVIDGTYVTGVKFSAFKTKWPKDPEFRRLDETVHFLEQIYGRKVEQDDVVTVVRFSQISDRPPEITERLRRDAPAQN